MTAGGAFRVDEWTVEPGLNQLHGPSGTTKLRPQIMELLVYLAERRGVVVTADELMDGVWEGKVVTSASIYNAIAELRQALAHGDESAVYVETIPKRGYRLVAAVADLPEAAPATARAPAVIRRRLLVAATGLGAIGLLLWLGSADRASDGVGEKAAIVDAARAERSIAVLPLDDMSPAGNMGWFADGVTEEILNSLARLPELEVASRTSAFLVRARQLSFAEIAEALGVRFVVEGSIRRDGDSVRVTYQVIRAADGFHLYSDTIDGNLGGIFELQEKVATTVAEALNVVLDDEKRQAMSGLGTRDVEAYEYYLRGIDSLYDWYATGSGESIWAATDWFDKAIDEDPRFGFVHGLRAHTMMRYLEAAIPTPTWPDRTTAAMTRTWAREQILDNQSAAARFARSEAMKRLFEISLVVFSEDYRRLPDAAARFDARVAEELPDGLDVDHVLQALLITGHEATVLDFSLRRIRRNPLDGLGYNQAWGAAMVAGDRAAAADFLERARRDAGDVKFTELNLLFSRIIDHDWAAAAELAGQPDWGIEAMREPILAFVYAAGGRRADAVDIVDRLLAAGRSGPYLALALREIGRVDEARAMIGMIDASPAGNLIGIYLFKDLGGRFPYDPAWMPNFAARMVEANVTLKLFETGTSQSSLAGRDPRGP